LAALGEGVGRGARMVPLPNGAVVRGCDEESGQIAVFGPENEGFFGLKPLRFGASRMRTKYELTVGGIGGWGGAN